MARRRVFVIERGSQLVAEQAEICHQTAKSGCSNATRADLMDFSTGMNALVHTM